MQSEWSRALWRTDVSFVGIHVDSKELLVESFVVIRVVIVVIFVVAAAAVVKWPANGEVFEFELGVHPEDNGVRETKEILFHSVTIRYRIISYQPNENNNAINREDVFLLLWCPACIK